MAINPLQAQGYGSEHFKRQKLTRDIFDSDAYLQANKDVADAGIDAWTHYNDMGGGDQWWRPWSTEDKALDPNHGKQEAPQQQAPAPQQQAAPPPPPPVIAPPPVPAPIAPPANAPDFKALAAMAPAQMGQTYQPTGTSALMMDSQLMQALEKFAMEGLQNPSRWDQALVKDSVGVIDDSVKRNRSEGERALMERMAMRGTLGDNSIMWDEGYSLEDRLDENERAAKNQLAQTVAGDYAADRSTAAGIALNSGQFKQSLGRDMESDNQFAAGFNRMTGRDYEDDLRARTGFNLQGGSLTEDALMARALFGMNAQNQSFQQGMQSAQFGENQRQFNADFGLRDYLGRAGIDLDNRRVNEGIRQFDVMNEQEKTQFAASLGLNKAQLEEQIRHNQQLETVAMMDYLERTNSEFTIDDKGRIVPKGTGGQPATDTNTADNKTPPYAVLTFGPGEYGTPTGVAAGVTWKDPSGETWKWDGTKWKRDITYAN